MSETIERTDQAARIIKYNVGWSAAAGLTPLPLFDLAAISAVQIRMIKQLADLYGVPFRKELVKSLIGAAIGGGTAFAVAAPIGSMVKAIPGIGTFISTFVTPAAAATATYALGKVFMQHFDAGGTLLDMNPDTLRTHYYQEFNRRQHAAPQEATAQA